MAKLIEATTVVHPDSGQVVSLRSGDELPDWVKDLVGEHLLDGESKPARRVASK